MTKIRTSVYLGNSKEQASRRLEALRKLAKAAGFVHAGKGNVNGWLLHLADQEIKRQCPES